jgi:hypothetical protein
MKKGLIQMKKKTPPAPEPIIPREILEQAKIAAAQADVLKRAAACVVCGSECAPNSTEQLCWVCRRLKISAWRDADPQLSAQE